MKLFNSQLIMFKLTFGADLGFDNGIYDGGSHATVEEAIKVADDELLPAHQVYGAFVTDLRSGDCVAESNGTWGDQIPWWHCKIPPTPNSNERPCQCGSGQPWVVCSANSQYCG